MNTYCEFHLCSMDNITKDEYLIIALSDLKEAANNTKTL